MRHAIVALLEGEELTAREISEQLGIGERDVYSHLEHIQLHRDELHLTVTPAACRKCGFIFKKRERLRKPGRCPVCRGEFISPPSFSIQRGSPAGYG
ncbi:transcriptional regulator [Geotalea sp. SG265]|uniref:transcriptional regulator n=1 Tax=Geotalea sp. SG265 TaxID=2922867 RepID=UPI001FB03CFB|nr:transcriptional regulator [Geotalea sp. SG265]